MVVGALVLVGRPKVPHWKEMNAVLDSFPIPAGYHVAERRQAGGYQWFDLPNEHPIAGMTLRPGSESMPPCVALGKYAAEWLEDVYTVDFFEAGTYRVRPISVFALRESEFATSPTRWTFT